MFLILSGRSGESSRFVLVEEREKLRPRAPVFLCAGGSNNVASRLGLAAKLDFKIAAQHSTAITFASLPVSLSRTPAVQCSSLSHCTRRRHRPTCLAYRLYPQSA
jgi:hypothetical protein